MPAAYQVQGAAKGEDKVPRRAKATSDATKILTYQHLGIFTHRVTGNAVVN